MDTSDGTNSDGALLESTWVTGQHIMQFQSLDANQAFDSHAWPANAVVHEPLPQQMMQQVDLEAVPDPSACPPAMGHSTLHGVVCLNQWGVTATCKCHCQCCIAHLFLMQVLPVHVNLALWLGAFLSSQQGTNCVLQHLMMPMAMAPILMVHCWKVHG